MKTAAMQRAMSVVLCLVLVGLLCLPCAAQEQSVLSPWAVEEVAQAWETGIVPADLDLGKITLRRFPAVPLPVWLWKPPRSAGERIRQNFWRNTGWKRKA